MKYPLKIHWERFKKIHPLTSKYLEPLLGSKINKVEFIKFHKKVCSHKSHSKTACAKNIYTFLLENKWIN